MSSAPETPPIRHGYIRPRDAASILVIDRSGGVPRVLMGRRSSEHLFMPNVYVFPGGRRDSDDHRISYSVDLHPDVLTKLMLCAGGRMTPSRARALAQAAVRELAEETGLLLGTPGDLSRLRFIARAITPPGFNLPRRFDTRFFCCFTDESGIDPATICDSAELLDLQWVDIADFSCLNMPRITRTILEDVRMLMKDHTSLGFDMDVPFYFDHRGQHVRKVL